MYKLQQDSIESFIVLYANFIFMVCKIFLWDQMFSVNYKERFNFIKI